MKLICTFVLFISTILCNSQTSSHNICCGLQDRSGNLWFGTTCKGVFRYDPVTGNFTNFTKNDGLIDNYIACMLEDTKGNLWFGTQDGVSTYDGKTFTGFSIAGTQLKFPVDSLSTINHNGFITNSPNWINSILQDKSGNIWFGSNGYGVYRYDGTSITIFTEKDGLCFNYIESIIEDHTNGNLWFGTRGGGFCSYNGKSFTSMVEDDIKYNHIFCIFEDKAGNIWITTVNGGVRLYNPVTRVFTNFTWKDGLCSTGITCILEDKNGNLLFGSDDAGVCRYDGKSFISFTTNEVLCSNRIWNMLEDKEGNIWFGTRNVGLCRYNPSTGVITDFTYITSN
jgi:ligand-binding sensor domain-containing protein